jgi:hypothetical protein
MANSADFSFVPFIGGFVSMVDPDDGITKPAIFDNASAFIPVTNEGNGNTPSALTLSPQGREGSMKNAIQLIARDSLAFETYDVGMFINIPAGARGLPPSRFTSAQLLDSANYPLYDASQFMPLLFAVPTFSQFSEGAVPPLSTPFMAPAPTTVPALNTIELVFGVIGFAPPQLYSTVLPPTIVTSSLSQYGVIAARLRLIGEPDAEVVVQAGQAFQLVTDFSWSAGN